MSPDLAKLLSENASLLVLAGCVLLLLILAVAWSTAKIVRRMERRQASVDKAMEANADRMGHSVSEKILAAIPGEEGIRSVAKDEIARGFVDLRAQLRESETAAETANRERAAEIKRLLSEHAVYLHDRFADIAAREEERLRATRDSAAADAARRAAEDRAEMRETLSASLKQFAETMDAASRANAESLAAALKGVSDSMNRLAAEVDAKLARMLERVENKLSENIGDARKSFEALRERMDKLAEERSGIEELGRDVASMSRLMLSRATYGAEGPAQLAAILEGSLSPENYSLNAKMKNGAKADAILHLPPPNGDIAMDAGLPLANFARLTDDSLDRPQRESARKDFAADLRARIDYVAAKLIPRSAGGAMLFVPTEAAFAELQAHCREEVERAARSRVWLVSPATMMAVINTARAALRDYRARAELERLRDGLREVADLFAGLEKQMAKVGGHVNSAWRGIQDAENRGAKLMGKVQNLADSANENKTLEADDDPEPSPPLTPPPSPSVPNLEAKTTPTTPTPTPTPTPPPAPTPAPTSAPTSPPASTPTPDSQ